MFLGNYRTIAIIALGLGMTIHLPQRSLLYQEEYPPDLLLLLSLAKVVLHKVLYGERIEEEDPFKELLLTWSRQTSGGGRQALGLDED